MHNRVDTTTWIHHMDHNKNAASYIEHVLEAKPYKAVAIRTPTTHHENYPN